MKIAVVGSRKFKDEEFIYDKLSKYFTHYSHEDVLISGGARGVDTIAEEFLDRWLTSIIVYYDFNWEEFKPTKQIFEAKWDDLSQPGAIIKTNRYGKKYDARAGFRRNKLIINEADKVIAFWNGSSTGTKHSIDLAIKANKPIDIYIR